MSPAERLTYLRMRWPDDEIPAGEPEWFLYELDRQADAVVRSVALYPDGRTTRNSIALEQRYGDSCPSLLDCSLAEAFVDVEAFEIDAAAFEAFWSRGVNEPFWFDRPPEERPRRPD
jgi:hypothetical protein